MKKGAKTILREEKMSEEFSFKNWVSEGAKGLRESLHVPGGGLLPEEFHEHMKTSRKEFLLAFRSLFDSAIESADKPRRSSRRKVTKIKVE
jgi:hypothetical protein